MGENHPDDIRNIAEGDEVIIETTSGDTLDMTCTEIDKSNADPRTGEVRETTMWFFDLGGEEVVFSRVEGLRSSESDPEFPVDKPVWNIDQEMGYGYVESLKILGANVQA